MTSDVYPDVEQSGAISETGKEWVNPVFNQSVNQATNCGGGLCARTIEQWHITKFTWSTTGTRAVSDNVVIPAASGIPYHVRSLQETIASYSASFITVAAQINPTNARCNFGSGQVSVPSTVDRVADSNVGASGTNVRDEVQTSSYYGYVMPPSNDFELEDVDADAVTTYGTIIPLAITLYAQEDFFSEKYLAVKKHGSPDRQGNANYPKDGYDITEGFITDFVGDAGTD
jgi:hypothetical protein